MLWTGSSTPSGQRRYAGGGCDGGGSAQLGKIDMMSSIEIGRGHGGSVSGIGGGQGVTESNSGAVIFESLVAPRSCLHVRVKGRSLRLALEHAPPE